MSAFGPLYKTNEIAQNNKKELLKINIDNKPASKGNSRYQTEKKKEIVQGRNIIVKTKSSTKL